MPDSPEIKISPSILSADFGRLGEQVAEASDSGADYIHVDIMDGHFVPNLTIGPIIVSGIRPWTELPLDVHLMIEEPDRLIPDFAKAGANHTHRPPGGVPPSAPGDIPDQGPGSEGGDIAQSRDSRIRA